MTSKRKKIGLIFLVVFSIALVGLFVVKCLVNNKFEDLIQNLPNHIDLQYDNADIDIISGNLTLEKPILTIKGKVAERVNAQIALKTFEIKDLSYWDFYKNDAINLASVKISEPKITYYHNKKVEGQSYGDVLKGISGKTFNIGALNINDATIEVFDVDNDSLLFSSEKLNIQLSTVTSKSSETSKFPFKSDDFSLTSGRIKYQLSDFDDLFIKSIDINTQNSKLIEIKIKTKYSKEELSKHLKTERDYFDLSLASVEIENQQLVSDKNSALGFKAAKVVFDSLHLEVYRDKLVEDDLNHKLLYSNMLRGLTFGLNLSEIIVNNGQITYEEKVKTDNQAGKLEFSNLEAHITNVSNLNENAALTKISINTNFMKEAPLKIDWNFDVSDVNDQFVFKADLGLLKADALNQFMQPNLNLKLKGELNKTYFTIDGNANTSRVNLKTDYDQFDVILLKEDGREKNKLLSGLLNLLISKNSKDELNNFRESDTETVERDKTKSVFNFVWKNMQAGLLSAMVGDGEKDN